MVRKALLFGAIIVLFQINGLEKIDFRNLFAYDGKAVEIAGFVVEKEGKRYLVANPSRRPCCQDESAPPLLLEVPSQDLPSYQRQTIEGIIRKGEEGWRIEPLLSSWKHSSYPFLNGY